MYGLIKTHKVGNPVRVITSGCGTAIENLSIFVGKCLYSEVLKIESRVKDTQKFEKHSAEYQNYLIARDY